MSESAVHSIKPALHPVATPGDYRNFVRSGDLVSSNVAVKQTNLLVSGSRDLGSEAMKLVRKYRRAVEGYIQKHPSFEKSLVSIERDPSAPEIIKTMIEAAAQTGVGPMASVAGTIAEYVGKDLLQHSRDVIVENGGDIFIRSAVERQVLLLAETSELSAVRIVLPPTPDPIGLCTSSGTLGPSLSFGNADAVTVLWSSASLADAAATAIANLVQDHRDMQKGIRRARELGVDGVVILVDGHIGAWGNITFGG